MVSHVPLHWDTLAAWWENTRWSNHSSVVDRPVSNAIDKGDQHFATVLFDECRFAFLCFMEDCEGFVLANGPVCDHPVSQYSIGLRTYHFWHQDDVIDQCWPVIMVYGSVLHLILDSTWVWYGLLPELKVLTIGLTLRLFLVSATFLDTVYCEAHSLQVMRTQLETLGEEFKLAGNIWWRICYVLNLDLEMRWHCEDNDHIWASYLSESFMMRCFGIVRTIPTSSPPWLWIMYLIL